MCDCSASSRSVRALKRILFFRLSSQLFINTHSYFRTMEGFAVLVQKDWCAFGHKFHDRLGHGHKPELSDDSSHYFATKECSPVFLQFIEAVAQIQRQIPDAFEFNKDFLIFLIDASYSCEFGNFLCNNERERDMLKLTCNSTSVWDYMFQKSVRKSRFTNHTYEPERGPIWPSSATRHLVFWDDYYMRYDPCRLRRGVKGTGGILPYGLMTPSATPSIVTPPGILKPIMGNGAVVVDGSNCTSKEEEE